MNTLWAPWRMDYVGKKKAKSCLFCRAWREERDEENLVLFRGKVTFVIMNRFPYNNGHLMVAPRRHITDFEAFAEEEVKEFVTLMKGCLRVLKATFRPEGFNIGINLGVAGGAGFPHLHLHVVPRWKGDTNFMPVLSETKVIPQHLGETYKRLFPAFGRLASNGARRKGGPKGEMV